MHRVQTQEAFGHGIAPQTNQPGYEARLRLRFQPLTGSERPASRPIRPGGVVLGRVLRLTWCLQGLPLLPHRTLALRLVAALFFHFSTASLTPDWTWHLPLWQLQEELSAGPLCFSSAVTRRRGVSMDTGLGKRTTASPEATLHAPQVGDAAGPCG